MIQFAPQQNKLKSRKDIMSDKQIEALKDALELKQKELDLITAIDEVRDSISEPEAMFKEIVNLLADRFEADLCLLFLLDRETGVVKPTATNDRSQQFEPLQQLITRELAERAVRLDDVTGWVGHQELPEESLTILPDNLHLIAAPIVMGPDERLGSLLLARSPVPFSPPEMQLLTSRIKSTRP
jgi:GTP-sensing pleiotropic transcriptional regulator CodY